MKKLKLLMHYNDYGLNVNRKLANEYGGIGYYRIIKVAEQLKKKYDVTVIGTEFISKYGTDITTKLKTIFSKFDVFWIPYFYEPAVGAALMFMRDWTKKKVIIDIDDNYLDILPSNGLYEQFKEKKWDRAVLSTILSFADAVTVSTYPLKERLQEHIKLVHGIDKPFYVIPNFNDVRDWKYPVQKPNPEKFIIGYSGSTSHLDDLHMVLPSVVKIMQTYPHVWFEMLGLITVNQAKTIFKDIPRNVMDRMALIGATDTFKEYPKWLAGKGWDMGIAPLVDSAFTRSKSSIKWFEYSMYKIPTIASRVYPYFIDLDGKKLIEDGVTGLLCRPHEWFEKIEKLVVDQKLRKTLGRNAYAHIKKYWQYKDSNIVDIVGAMLKPK